MKSLIAVSLYLSIKAFAGICTMEPVLKMENGRIQVPMEAAWIFNPISTTAPHSEYCFGIAKNFQTYIEKDCETKFRVSKLVARYDEDFKATVSKDFEINPLNHVCK